MKKTLYNNDNEESMIYEHIGIGLQNESTLHSNIKRWYAIPGDRIEVKVDNYVVDIVRDELLIEIQTKNFGAIKKKLNTLSQKYKVRLVYPISIEKWITTIDTNGEVISRRKSPKRGTYLDVFDELVRMPEIINQENLSIEILMIKLEEMRRIDGKGSWRRKGISILDRRLTEVSEQISFNNKEDFKMFIPDQLAQPFTNKELAQAFKIAYNKAQKITYCLKRMGVIQEKGKRSRELLYGTVLDK